MSVSLVCRNKYRSRNFIGSSQCPLGDGENSPPCPLSPEMAGKETGMFGSDREENGNVRK